MLFERCYVDIWQHVPFRAAHGVHEFVQRFVKDGQFDAECFWEYVAKQVQASVPKKRSPSERHARAASVR